MRQRKKIYRRKIVGGFLGNVFTKIIESAPGIVHKVAPIALDASKSGTAAGQRKADEVKGNRPEIKQVISEIAPAEETKRAMIRTKKKKKKLLSPRGEQIIQKTMSKATAPHYII